MKTELTETAFRALCAHYGTPDDVPCDEMPEEVAAVLSMADRFFDAPDDVDAALAELHRYGLIARPAALQSR